MFHNFRIREEMRERPPRFLNAYLKDQNNVFSFLLIKLDIPNTNDPITKEAFKDPTYLMLFFGFFSCGFQLAFLTAHFPAFIAETSSPIIQGSLISIVCNSVASLGALSIALIGVKLPHKHINGLYKFFEWHWKCWKMYPKWHFTAYNTSPY